MNVGDKTLIDQYQDGEYVSVINNFSYDELNTVLDKYAYLDCLSRTGADQTVFDNYSTDLSSEYGTTIAFRCIQYNNKLLNRDFLGALSNIQSIRIASFAEKGVLCSFLYYLSNKQPTSYFSEKSDEVSNIIDNLMIMTQIKDEDDIIFSSLSNWYNWGIRNICISYNLCSDNTFNQVQEFKKANPDFNILEVLDNNPAHYESAKKKALAKYAVEYFNSVCGTNINLIFSLDADEWFAMDIDQDDKKRFAKMISDALSNSAPAIYFFMVDKTTHEKSPKDFNYEDYTGSSVSIPAILSGGMPTKIAFPPSSIDYIVEGNHCLNGHLTNYTYDDIVLASDYNIHLAHYNLRSLYHVRKKVINGGVAFSNATKLNNSVGSHWRERYKNYLEYGEDFLGLILNNYNNTNIDLSSINEQSLSSSNLLVKMSSNIVNLG